MQAIKFKNFSNEDFTHAYDSVPYTFKAGSEMFLEDFKAQHFAKHLVDRELNRLNLLTSDRLKRKELETLCFPADEVVTPVEALNLNKKVEVKAKKGKKVEKEFEDLDK